MSNIVIYSTANCSYCVRAKSLLAKKGVSYTEIRVDLDREKFAEMLSRSQGRRTVPQIFINDQPIGGFTDLWALDKKGELDKLLG